MDIEKKEATNKLSDYLVGRSGAFYNHLFRAIFVADNNNLKRLSAGFPHEVRAYNIYIRTGKGGSR